MAKLEDLTPNAAVKGMLHNCQVTVVNVQWHGSEAVELTYKDPGGRVDQRLLYRHDEPSIEIVQVCAHLTQSVDSAQNLLARKMLVVYEPTKYQGISAA